MKTYLSPSSAKQFALAIHHRRQPVRSKRTSDGIIIREVNTTLAYISSRHAAAFASGRRAIGRAVRFVRAESKKFI